MKLLNPINSLVFSTLLVFVLFTNPTISNAAGGEGIEITPQDWSFGGVRGHYDQAQLQRGYKVYREVCAVCHSMKLLSYRNLGEPGGPEFPEAEVKTLAEEATIIDGPNDEGEMFERPGKPSDRFASPFPNDNAARSANGGALPPDLSVMAKARGIPLGVPWYVEPFFWIRDIFSSYQEQGADYLYALMTGYKDPPADVQLAEGMHYNAAFPGHQIAMPSPLSADSVDYDDGTPQTVSQYSSDVTAFMMWAAEPHLEERKKLGFRVMLYLLVLTLLLYLVKRKVWSRLKH